MLARVKKNDNVLLLSGRDKGKEGVVLAVYPKDDLVLVKDIGVVVRHKKSNKAGQKGSLIREERPVASSKVMPICSGCKKPCRVQIRFLDSGDKIRICGRCKEAF